MPKHISPQAMAASIVARQAKSIAQNFDEAYVPEPNTGCFLWLRSVSGECKRSRGYPSIMVNGHRVRVSRWIWEKTHGPIPEGLFVCHKCDTQLCVNVGHFFLGTNRDNILDASRKHRLVSGERMHTAKLTAAQVLEMREKYATGKFSQKGLSREYGVSKTRAHFIVHRKSWNHI